MTEAHSTSLYVPSGKGILYIAEWSGTTAPTDPGDYTDLGNCPSFESEPTQERLPHFSSRTQYRLKDKNPIIAQDYTLTFELDEFSAANLNIFLSGVYNTDTGVVNAMQAGDAEFALKFVSDNPSGPNQIYKYWKVSLQPNGALQLISDGDYLTMSFTGEGLADTDNHPTSPYFDVKFITTTTTTTTTTTS